MRPSDLAGFAHDVDSLINPRNPDVSGLRRVANDEFPLEIYFEVEELRRVVTENHERLQAQRTNADRDPDLRMINDMLAAQREAFLEALDAHPDDHVFVKLVPVNPFEPAAEEEE